MSLFLPPLSLRFIERLSYVGPPYVAHVSFFFAGGQPWPFGVSVSFLVRFRIRIKYGRRGKNVRGLDLSLAARPSVVSPLAQASRAAAPIQESCVGLFLSGLVLVVGPPAP